MDSRPSTTKRPVRKAKTLRVKRGLHDMTDFYTGINGFSANTIGGNKSSTYGEISLAGLQPLADTFKRFAPLAGFDKTQRNFVDLGSGIGKAVIGIAMLVPEIQSNGIESVHERHEMALSARKRIHTNSLANRIHFRHGNFLEPPYVFKNACWIFVSNLSFSDDLQAALAKRLEAECAPKTLIICSKELPLAAPFECLDRGIVIPMSWSATSSCHVYRRSA
jgi:Histone methylation protein DOT1